MRASRWMVVSALGIVAMGVGCGDDTQAGATASTTSSASVSGSGGAGAGGSGGTGTGGGGGMGGAGGSGGMGTGGSGAGGTGGAGGQNFAFTMSGTGYIPLAGVMMFVTAVASGDGTTIPIGSATIANDGMFVVTGEVLGGDEYTVGWYADINGNQACDAVPTDLVWAQDIPVVIEEVVLDVQPNGDYKPCQ
jgi:hypothetical protein